MPSNPFARTYARTRGGTPANTGYSAGQSNKDVYGGNTPSATVNYNYSSAGASGGGSSSYSAGQSNKDVYGGITESADVTYARQQAEAAQAQASAQAAAQQQAKTLVAQKQSAIQQEQQKQINMGNYWGGQKQGFSSMDNQFGGGNFSGQGATGGWDNKKPFLEISTIGKPLPLWQYQPTTQLERLNNLTGGRYSEASARQEASFVNAGISAQNEYEQYVTPALESQAFVLQVGAEMAASRQSQPVIEQYKARKITYEEATTKVNDIYSKQNDILGASQKGMSDLLFAQTSNYVGFNSRHNRFYIFFILGL